MKNIFYIYFILITGYSKSQQLLPYKNQNLPISKRVIDLLGRMTPEEKFRQLFMAAGDITPDSSQFKEGAFGIQLNTSGQEFNGVNQLLNYQPGLNEIEAIKKINGVQHFFLERTRLGIPIISFDEALHGLVRKDATAFPQAIAMAATFDTSLIHSVASAIATECQSRGIRLVLSPVLNLATDPRWGRVEETYGEDPYLASCMGIAYVRAFEEKNIATTPKHFLVNHGDGGRDSYPIFFNKRQLEETYLVPFKAVIKNAGARGIMTAYNSLDGKPCSANEWLLRDKLKKEWGFTGIVISDAGAVGGANVLHFTAKDYEDAGKQATENGLDVIFQSSFDSYQLFKKPFINGSTNKLNVDSAVTRVLRLKMELGLFEQPYVKQENALSGFKVNEHRALALKAALKSVVLLKNDSLKILPLNGQNKKIALIGIDATEARLGGYSGPGIKKVSIYEALKKEMPTCTVQYLPGCGRNSMKWKAVPSSNLWHIEDGKMTKGLKAEYFNNITLNGTSVIKRIDSLVDFQWTLFSPHPSVNYDFFSVRWTGTLLATTSGKYKIGIEGNDGYRLFLNEKLLIDTWSDQSYHTRLQEVTLKKGEYYNIRIEYKESSGNSRFRFIWDQGTTDSTEKSIQEAVELAAKSDIIIVVAGIEEGEFRDRSSLKLPGRQEEMILKLAESGKPMVVLISGGSAVIMEKWLDKVNAVMDIWYPGEAGGEAIAKLLSGKENPSGKLPITFPVNEGQLPLYYNHKPTGRGDDYLDGTGKPRFPFGFGLSYTTFEYYDLKLSKTIAPATDTILCSFKLKNCGTADGEEVVQFYIFDEIASVVRPIKELKGFQRVFLQKGQEKYVTFKIVPGMLTMLDDKLNEVIEPGFFRIMIGGSSTDIRLRERFEIKP